MPDTITVDAAVGGPWEELGKVIDAIGGEDSSGLRRAVVAALGHKDWELALRYGVPRDEAERLRRLFVDAWGEP